MRFDEVVPEVALIEDERIRRAVVKVWESALAEAGLDASALREMPFCADVPPGQVSLAAHISAVTRTAAHLADLYREVYGVSVERDALLAAALLHDVGKLDERRDPRLEHSLSGVLRANAAGLPTPTLHAIAFHSEAAAEKRRCVEAELLYFADFVHYRPLLRVEGD